MLKLQTVIFSVLTLCILSNYAVIAIDEIEERQKLSLEDVNQGEIKSDSECKDLRPMYCKRIMWQKCFQIRYGSRLQRVCRKTCLLC